MVLASFHPTVRSWFRAELGEPTAAQLGGWRNIQAGHHTLIAAPTGSGKTLAAFLASIDQLLRQVYRALSRSAQAGTAPAGTQRAGTDDLTDEPLSGPAETILGHLTRNGATFPQELSKATGLLPSYFETGLCELIALGRIQCDSFGALRQFFKPSSKRTAAIAAFGRWSVFREPTADTKAGTEAGTRPEHVEFVARLFLRRYGVVVRRVLDRERFRVPWRDLPRVFRLMELRGEVRGGRFVAGCDGEHFALDSAVELLREVRNRDSGSLQVAAADPLNLRGILTPDERIASNSQQSVEVL